MPRHHRSSATNKSRPLDRLSPRIGSYVGQFSRDPTFAVNLRSLRDGRNSLLCILCTLMFSDSVVPRDAFSSTPREFDIRHASADELVQTVRGFTNSDELSLPNFSHRPRQYHRNRVAPILAIPVRSRNTICAINKETVKAEVLPLRSEAGFKATTMFQGKKQCCWTVLSLAFRLVSLSSFSQPVILCLPNIRCCT